MHNGISVYPGMSPQAAKLEELLVQAKQLGLTRVFSSVHLPEVAPATLLQSLQQLLELVERLELELCLDVTPQTAPLLQGLSSCRLRLDDGYSLKEIVALSQQQPLQLNASTLSYTELQELAKLGMNWSQAEAMFNYYPKPHTGMSAEALFQQTKLLHSFGLQVAAFVPSQAGPRAPLYAGLPTLEAQRYLPLGAAASQLLDLGVDSVFIGDAEPSLSELEALSKSAATPITTLRIQLLQDSTELRELLLQPLTMRPDTASELYRTIEGRSRAKELTLAPLPACEQQRGTISIDNTTALRYKGELQISKGPLPADTHCNVIAQVIDEDLYLLDTLQPHRKLQLQII